MKLCCKKYGKGHQKWRETERKKWQLIKKWGVMARNALANNQNIQASGEPEVNVLMPE